MDKTRIATYHATVEAAADATHIAVDADARQDTALSTDSSMASHEVWALTYRSTWVGVRDDLSIAMDMETTTE